MKWLALSVLVVLSIVMGYAQSATNRKDSTAVPSMIRFGLQYRSDYYFMGRADSAKAPYLTPSIAYYHKSGLFVSTNLSYLTVKEQGRIDLITLSGGYDYYRNHVAAGISVTEYFFSDSSFAVQSEMSTFMSAYIGYEFRPIMIVVDGGMGVSEDIDYFLGIELSKSFYLLRDRLRLTPSFYTNFGTQNYYREYYTKRSITTGGNSDKGKGSSSDSNKNNSDSGGSSPGSGGTAGTTQPPETTTITEVTTLNSEKFQVLNYELTLQASYRLNDFRFIGSATVLFPVNPSTVVTDQGTYTEELNTGFLWSLGVRYTIK